MTPAPEATTTRVTASARALELLRALEAANGPVSLHVSGSYGVSVVCLPRAELRLGSRDVLMGAVAGVPVYMMSAEVKYWIGGHLRLDVAQGRAAGFSLDSTEGVHFFVTKPDCAIRRLKETVGVSLD